MKISELIAELEEVKEAHGDIKVEVFSEYEDFGEIMFRFQAATNWSEDTIELIAYG